MRIIGTMLRKVLPFFILLSFSCSNLFEVENENLEVISSRSVDSQFQDWETWKPYSAGDRVSYNGSVYQCIQSHTSQPDWNPSIVPALWKQISVKQQKYPYIDLWESGEDYVPGQWVEYNSDFYFATQRHSSQSSWNPSAAASVWEQMSEDELAPNYENILYNSHFNWKVGGWPILNSNSFFSDNMWHVAGISTSYGKLRGGVSQDISGKVLANTPYNLAIGIRNVNDSKVKISIQQKSGDNWNDISTTGWKDLSGKGEPKTFKGMDGRWYTHILGDLEYINAVLTTPDDVSGKLRFVIETDTGFNNEMHTLFNLTLKRQAFAKVDGDKIMINGQEFNMRGIAFTNFYYLDDLGSYVNNDFTRVKHHRQEDFYKIKQLGFNTIRFALNGEWFKKGNVKDNSQKLWDWIDESIEMAKKEGLYVLLEMHIPSGQTWLVAENAKDYDRESPEWFWNVGDEVNRLYDTWEAIAERYANEPTVLAYGLLNEPKGTDETGEQWYTVVAPTLIEKVRAKDTNHIIVIDGYTGMIHYNNQDGLGVKTESTMDAITFPDQNLIYDNHFYETGEYTHKGAEWGGGIDNKSSYPDDHAPIGDIWNYWKQNAANNYTWHKHNADGTTTDYPDEWTTISTPEYTPVFDSENKGKEGDMSEVLIQPKLVVAGDLGDATVLFDNVVLLEKKVGEDNFYPIREIPVEKGVLQYKDENGNVTKTEEDKTSDGFIYWAESYWGGSYPQSDVDATYGKQVIETNDGSDLDDRYSDTNSVGVSGSKALAVWIQTWLVVMANEGSTYRLDVDMKVIGTPATTVDAGPLLQFYADPRKPRPANVEDEKDDVEPDGGYRLGQGFNKNYLERNLVRDYRPFSYWTDKDVPETILEFGLMDICYDSQSSGISNGGDQWLRDVLSLFSKYNVGWATWAFRNQAMGMFKDLKHGAIDDFETYVDWDDDSQKNMGIFNAVETIMAY